MDQITNPNPDLVKILAKNPEEPLEKYLLKVLAAYRIGCMENYSKMEFAIDPGVKHIGFVVFLEDFYLNSHTFYNLDSLIEKIKSYIEFLEENQSNLYLEFKFGMGILSLTLELVSNLYSLFENDDLVRFYLIDESKSSKISVVIDGRRMPKHEVSALILALRDGIEISKKNYINIFTNIKKKKIKLISYSANFQKENNGYTSFLKDLILKIIKGELSLTSSLEKIHNWKITNLL
ncbi:MAG: hypothetical protein JW891_15490 [Candidatus Lokiarchaeota archaeon]|nr:hypothetical protein [Candidatus Lokiarchaeota archaeon]